MITVGIPTKSAIPQLSRAIQSVLEQTYKNFEILIVNDSGNPNLPGIRAIQEEYEYLSNFRIVHHKENLGIGGARNSVIENARGEYIFYLSDDDLLCPMALEKFLKTAEEHPNSVIYSDYLVVDMEGNIRMELRSPRCKTKEEFKQKVIEFAKHDSMFVCYNLLAPTKILKQHKFLPEIRFGEDFEHLLRCVLIEDVSFILIPEFLHKYTAHKGSTTTAKAKQIHENDSMIRKQINKRAGRRIFDE